MFYAGNNSTGKTARGRTCASVQRWMLLCAILFASGALHPARAQGSPEEYQVKAAFLFHFAQLVDWPAGALSASDQSINLCIFVDEPKRKELQDTIEGKLVGSRILHVRVLDPRDSIQGCNILFLSRDQERRQTPVLKSLHDLPVLTVGETDNFLVDGGMIHFRTDGDKIRFDINAAGANACHLRISSRLLLLATSVTLPPGSNGGKTDYAH